MLKPIAALALFALVTAAACDAPAEVEPRGGTGSGTDTGDDPTDTALCCEHVAPLAYWPGGPWGPCIGGECKDGGVCHENPETKVGICHPPCVDTCDDIYACVPGLSAICNAGECFPVCNTVEGCPAGMECTADLFAIPTCSWPAL